MEIRPSLMAAVALAVSLTWTWFAFFSQRCSFEVAFRATRPVVRVYPAMNRGLLTGRRVVDGFFLTDQCGQEWEVDEAAYRRAIVGQEIHLRQWVDRWKWDSGRDAALMTPRRQRGGYRPR